MRTTERGRHPGLGVTEEPTAGGQRTVRRLGHLGEEA